jgi:predicted DNA-binding transcriptional regulator YafY
VAGDDGVRELHGTLRRACEEHRKVRALYQDEKGEKSERTILPLGMIGWSGKWTLLAWCGLRGDYRNFRFDRFQLLQVTDERFTPTAEISLAHYIQSVVGMRDLP